MAHPGRGLLTGVGFSRRGIDTRSRPAGRITAVTFDFWGTLYASEAADQRGRDRRRAEVVLGAVPSLASTDPPSLERLSRLIHDCAMMRSEDGRGLRAAERLGCVLAELGVELEPEALGALAREVAELGLEIPPLPLPGAREVVEAVGERHAVGLVSDTGLTEGRLLRELLRSDGLAPPMTAFGMSDETGWSKPSPGAFLPVLESLGAAPEQAVHVGDLAATDIVGALALGMCAVWIDARGTGSDPALSDLPAGAARRLRTVLALAEVPEAIRELERSL